MKNLRGDDQPQGFFLLSHLCVCTGFQSQYTIAIVPVSQFILGLILISSDYC